MMFSSPGLDYTLDCSMWNKRKHMCITIVFWRKVDGQKWGLADVVKSIQQVFSNDSSPASPPIVAESLQVQKPVWDSFCTVPDWVSHRELIHNTKKKEYKCP